MKSLIAALYLVFMVALPVSTAFGADEAPASPDTAAKAPSKAAGDVFIYFKAPIFSTLFSDLPVATVDDERITLDELNDALAALHESASEEKKTGREDFMPVLDRLINTRLIYLEAGTMGIDELPEVKSAIKDYSDATLRELLKNRHTQGVKPVKAEVDRFYKDAVIEWKLKSIIFNKEDDAKAMAEAVKNGKDFDAQSKEYIANKKAKGGEEGGYMGVNNLLSQISGAARAMKKGSVSPVIKVPDGYVIFRLEDVRYPEDAKAKAEAERQSLEKQRFEALQKYYDSLVKKYVKVDKKLFNSLDFEAKEPGFEKLLKDKRTLAHIKGDKSITVGDLTTALSEKFYHGVEREKKEKKLNSMKVPAFNELLYKRVFDKEVAREGIAKTEAFKKMLKEYKTSLIFSAFVQKVLVPDVKVTEDESKEYYEKHIQDFTYPEMMKLSSMAFSNEKDAKDALDKLRKGTDFKWLNANAEGQVKADKAQFLFDGQTLNVKGLGDDLQKALSGAVAGDYRLYTSPEGYSYVIFVEEDVPAKEQPYKEARDSVAKKLFKDKLNKSVGDWAEKLRKAHDVKVYVTKIGE